MKQRKKIIISPAILEKELSEFKRELNAYTQFAKQIDIDINIVNDVFDGKITLGAKTVCDLIMSVKTDIVFGIHLMVSKPFNEIKKFVDSGVVNKCIFYLQQETSIKEVLDSDIRPELSLGISIKASSKFQGIEFYQKFDEVQLMTVPIGVQGGKFMPEILNRVDKLRELGYKKRISIDGGVNLKTAELIREYDLDRVSVGSYFSKSENLKLDWMKLELALNM